MAQLLTLTSFCCAMVATWPIGAGWLGAGGPADPAPPALVWPLGARDGVSAEGDCRLLVPLLDDIPHAGVGAIQFSRGELACWDASRLRWRRPWESTNPPMARVARRGQFVFSTPFELVALDAANGALQWTCGSEPLGIMSVMADPEDFDPYRYHALAGNRIVNVRQSGQAECINLLTGATVWSASLPQPTGEIAFNGDTLVYPATVGDSASAVIVDGRSGRQRTHLPRPDETLRDVVLGPAGPIVLVTERGLAVHRTGDGALLWEIPNLESATVQAIVAADSVILLSADGLVIRIRLSNGEILWRRNPLPLGVETTGVRLQLLGDGLFVLGPDVALMLDKQSGMPIFRALLPSGELAVDALITRDILLLFTTDYRQEDPPLTLHGYNLRDRAAAELPGGGQTLCRYANFRGAWAIDGALLIQDGVRVQAWLHSAP
jgi:hypothetical protein